ncbi:MAG TPA: 3-methyl-2-oxobutanoate hydroxymethyltransferase [Bryobacteraceae bacterium]|nr:3-methyl-2-oxobutanoate hydroxymethyltransferase [Bryobacteraceae bacterium]HPT28463.1 3-methyl-2-oxobutanoate hydroxymethyltransferase [Bryobacteraceae bacterium]
MSEGPRRIRCTHLREKKKRGEKIVMLTAYDAAMARLLDAAGVDVLLVGDSLGMVVMGCETTLEVTLDAMIHHTRAVSRTARRALVVADMPFMTYQAGLDEAVKNAGALLQKGGAAAVKLEGGRAVFEVVRRMTAAGIPVMGHLGLLPQAVHQLGGFRKQATSAAAGEQLLQDALALEEAGAFAIVLESIPDALARKVTGLLAVPAIGIGAGPGCDGQVLVINDILGLSETPPPFSKVYFDAGSAVAAAAKQFAADVRSGRFPGSEEDHK